MNKIDFAIVISAEMCNPNGDPMNRNRPRIDAFDGHGEMTSVCIKRKIRNRLQEMGCDIFVQTDERNNDGCHSMKERADSYKPLHDELSKKKKASVDEIIRIACEKWMDVRAFGQVFPFKGFSASIGVRGPVSVGFARTLEPIDILDFTQTTSVNLESTEYMDSNRMRTEAVVRRGVYVTYGSIFPDLAAKTGLSDSDVGLIKTAMKTFLDNDASARRPSGSMVSALYWWEHDSVKEQQCGVAPSAKVFRSLRIEPSEEYPYYTVAPEDIPGTTLEICD